MASGGRGLSNREYQILEVPREEATVVGEWQLSGSSLFISLYFVCVRAHECECVYVCMCMAYVWESVLSFHLVGGCGRGLS